MNATKMLQELRDERDRIDEAIAVIQRLALANGAKRRGRPPRWVVEAKKAEK